MTIKDIATELNVSVSTVSKALNNATDVSSETRKKILDYANSADFTLKKRKTHHKRVCLFLEETGLGGENTDYGVLQGFKETAGRYGYEVVVKSATLDGASSRYDALMSEYGILGGFVLGTNLDGELFKQLKDTRYPTVVMNTFVDNPCVSSIGVDNVNPVALLVDRLCELGHRRIAVLCGEKTSAVSRERFSGYLCGLLSNRLEYDPSLVFFGDFTETCAARFVDPILESKATAVICASDLIAIGLIKELSSRGISVPDDVSVTGFDDVAVSRYVTPALTTVKQDFVTIGKKAFSLLRRTLKGGAPERVLISGKLILRESSGKAKNS